MRFVCFHDYARLSGGFVYNNRLVAALSGQVAELGSLAVPVGFPTIGAADLRNLPR